MGLPSERMNFALLGAPFEIVSSVAGPIVVGWVKLRRLRLENLESETAHIPNQYDRPQIGILLSRLLNASVPDLKNLPARFLYVRERVVVAEREDRGIAPGNQANALCSNRIS